MMNIAGMNAGAGGSPAVIGNLANYKISFSFIKTGLIFTGCFITSSLFYLIINGIHQYDDCNDPGLF